jgi:uncharacterized protein YdhG (YjbR/CyaY superfamily)
MKPTTPSKQKSSPQGSKAVDTYLATLPPESRRALQRIRQTIAQAAPGAEEGFSYGVPAFRLDGHPLAAYSASKKHCSYYPMSGDVLSAFARDLRAYDTLKGTIHFTPEKPLPAALVKRLVKARIAELRTSKG